MIKVLGMIISLLSFVESLKYTYSFSSIRMAFFVPDSIFLFFRVRGQVYN
ncbi:hypothetical protein M472_21570 [Sphingobacterium paucimobilis HER1398]|uniref:Uncharacterized protein n=1 Tax=Sphingobacterium paucimobilis HER1398 TaxID=1346330 RepID=U2JF95_9SPHI|nr:hypothetical protein M472_21570 [Sphingobacterium paucimobilis HER1398]